MSSLDIPSPSFERSSQERYADAFEMTEKLKKFHEWRGILLQDLHRLSEIKRFQKEFPRKGFETLSFMLRQDFVNKDGGESEDLEAFLHLEEIVKEKALEAIRDIAELDDVIAYTEERAGFSKEEVMQRSAVRKQLLRIHEREWGVS